MVSIPAHALQYSSAVFLASVINCEECICFVFVIKWCVGKLHITSHEEMHTPKMSSS